MTNRSCRALLLAAAVACCLLVLSGLGNVHAAGTVTWNHTGDGNWDTAATANWTGAAETYADGYDVIFDNTHSGIITIASTYGSVAPASTTVSGTYTFTGQPITTGTLTKSGAGTTLTLSSPNSYSGGTIINGGTLLANNSSGSATGSGSVTVNSGGTLGGTGTVTGAVTLANGGALAPGATNIGTLSATGGVAFNSGSVFDVEFTANSVPSHSSDKLDVTGGTLTITDGAILQLLDLGFATNSGPVTFTIAHYGSLIKTAGFTVQAPANFTYTIDYGVGTTDDITLTLIPEPSVIALLTVGGLALLRRRRK